MIHMNKVNYIYINCIANYLRTTLFVWGLLSHEGLFVHKEDLKLQSPVSTINPRKKKKNELFTFNKVSQFRI
jgi:hypothetical protein